MTSNRNYMSEALIKRLMVALRIDHKQAIDLYLMELVD